MSEINEQHNLIQPSWRIEIYTIKKKKEHANFVADISDIYTTSLTVTRERNYPDEISFTVDLEQLERASGAIGRTSREVLEPYKHNIRVYRNNEYVAQGIVQKVSVNMNNEAKNTVEVTCIDILGILERRLIHQDYGGGSWCDFAKEVVMDAQHEPNRIYNYAFEGDGTSISNVWFRGWKFEPGEYIVKDFPDWKPNHQYMTYETCTYDAKFWEANQTFISGEEFSESNWTLLGLVDPDTKDVQGAYAVWREDENEEGPTGTALGGWGGTSSCHTTAKTYAIDNGGSITGITMSGSRISTSLMAPLAGYSEAPRLPYEYQEVAYLDVENSSFNLGILPADTTVIKMKLKQTVTTDGVILGLVQGGTENHAFRLFNHNGEFYLDYGSGVGYNRIHGGTWDLNTTYNLEIGNRYVKNLTTGVNILYAGSVSWASFTAASDTIAYPAVNAKGRFYTSQFYQHDVLLRDMVPCVRKSDNKPGFYDMAGGIFYTDSNNGTVTAGPAVGPTTRQDGMPDIYTRFMARNVVAGESATVMFYLEGYGGERKFYSTPITISGTDWAKYEYNFPRPKFDVYRYGIKIQSGEVLLDTPLCYTKPETGDQWDLGIRIGDFPTGQEQVNAGWDRDRHTPIYELKNAKETLQDLSNMDSDNFWFGSDMNYNFNFYIDAGKKNVTLELSYPKNITSVTIDTNAVDLVNYIVGNGSDEVDQDPTVSGVNNTNSAPFTWIGFSEDSMKEYWPLAASESFNSERTIEALQGDIEAKLQTYANLLDVPKIQINNGAVSPLDFNLGDIISVAISNTPYAQRANGLYKVYSYTIDVDNDGVEALSITLIVPTARQLNTLSFPRLIKNLQNRVKMS